MNNPNDNGEFYFDNDYSVPSESNFLGDQTMQPLNINFRDENPFSDENLPETKTISDEERPNAD